MAAVTKLKFRIVFCSSEEPEFPASELLRHGPNSKGWSSARFCDYPQDLVLQFPTIVRIKQLQFLSHQCKISSKIELYTFTPDRPSGLPSIQDIPFKRLGYMSLDSNEKSGFQARELKSVYLDSTCLFLKVTLNKCHVNTANLFNQVGLIAINSLGEELGSQDEPGLIQGRQPRAKYEGNFEQDLEFDTATSERLRALQAAKQKAIENEDFEEAKHLKDAIERLKSVGVNLLQLEERKRMAVQNEDFESAKIIKMEIDRLRNAVAPPMPGVGGPSIFAPVQASSHRPFSGGPQPLGVGSRPISRRQPGQRDPYGEDARGPDMYAPRNAQIFDDPQDKAVPHDEQVIPTMAHGKAPGQVLGEDNGEPGEYDPRGPDDFTAQNAKLADPLIGVLGEDICKRLFSRSWQMREEALMKIKTQLEAGSGSELFGGVDRTQVMTVVLGAIRYTVLDKVSQVSMRSMEVIQTLFDWVGPARTPARGEAQEHIHNILQGLLEKIGDNAVKVRGLTEVAFLTMCRSDVVGCGPAVQLVLKPGGAKASSIKHTIGRLALLDKVVSEFKIDNPAVPFQPVVEYALNGYQNSSGEVRTASISLLKTIYDCVGSRLQQYLTKLRPAQLETLNSFFAGGEGPRDEEEPVGGNRTPSRKLSNPPARAPPQQLQQVPQCPFCGKTDPGFSSADVLDVHYWKECAMLVSCALCSMIIEIPKLNSHLLSECQHQDQAGECPRCKEAIPVEELDDHVEQQSCYPSKPPGVANRCPLCHEDVPAGVEGWKQHILTDGCPNNERSSY